GAQRGHVAFRLRAGRVAQEGHIHALLGLVETGRTTRGPLPGKDGTALRAPGFGDREGIGNLSAHRAHLFTHLVKRGDGAG
ncbi:hypothetical protein CDT93_21855, partial [Cronobacter sakazakii]